MVRCTLQNLAVVGRKGCRQCPCGSRSLLREGGGMSVLPQHSCGGMGPSTILTLFAFIDAVAIR